MELAAAKMIGAGLACIALVGAGIGIGNVFGSYLSGALRNPGAAATQTTNLLLGFALCEATGLFGLVIALIILFTSKMAASATHSDDGAPQAGAGGLSAVQDGDLPEPDFLARDHVRFLFVVLWRVAGPRINGAITEPAQYHQRRDHRRCQVARATPRPRRVPIKTALAEAHGPAPMRWPRKTAASSMPKSPRPRRRPTPRRMQAMAAADARIAATRAKRQGACDKAARDAAIAIVARLTGETCRRTSAAAGGRGNLSMELLHDPEFWVGVGFVLVIGFWCGRACPDGRQMLDQRAAVSPRNWRKPGACARKRPRLLADYQPSARQARKPRPQHRHRGARRSRPFAERRPRRSGSPDRAPRQASAQDKIAQAEAAGA